MEDIKLNKNSNIIGQPEGLKMSLREHQKAMLYKCLTIEKLNRDNKFPFGVIADPAGSGKTAVIISLLLSDRILYGKTRTLVVVPQNIFCQWIDEFKKFSGDVLKIKHYITYSEISELYIKPSIDTNVDVFITTPMYYDIIKAGFSDKKLFFKRIIFDEIDTSNKIFENIFSKNKMTFENSKNEKNTLFKPVDKSKEKIKSQMLWFVSASFEKMLIMDKNTSGIENSNGFYFMGEFVKKDQLFTRLCLCDEDFIKDSNFTLQPYEKKEYICDDLVLDVYWKYMSIEQIDACNSLSWPGSNKSSKEFVNNLVKEYMGQISITNSVLKNFMENDTEDDVIIKEISKKKNELEFYKKLIYSIHSEKCKETHDTINQYNTCITDNVKSISTTIPGIECKKNILKKIISKDKKILIFSDFSGTFNYISDILNDSDSKYSELSAGTPEDYSKQIKEYKDGDVNILMIDSSSQGCGINLENTDDIIFIHKTREVLYNQIIGRAQRPVRKSVLKVHELLNKNEITS